MAGDWIKMRGNLWDDPRVAKLCDLCDCAEAQIIGGLYWLWSSADQHTEDGCMPGLTLRQIDRKTGIQGFGAALCEIGWLIDDPQGVVIANFEEHNGASAKKRATTAKRVANHRSNDDVTPHVETSANDVTQPALQTEYASVTGALAREREREENSSSLRSEEVSGIAVKATPPTPPPPFDGDNAQVLNGRHVVTLSPNFDLPQDWGEDAERLGWKRPEILVQAEKFRQYWTVGKGQGTRRNVKGWRQTWSNWLAKAAEYRR